MFRQPRRYYTEPCPSPEAALEFIRKHPLFFYMKGGLANEQQAINFWKRRMRGLDEPLYFVRDRFTKNAIVGLDMKGAAEQRASIYEALARALGQGGADAN